MAGADVEEYVERSVSILDASAQMNERDVEDKILRPLIDLLGWDLFLDVTSQYPVQAGTTTIHVDYALLDDNSALVFIETKASQRKLDDDSADQLVSYMRSAGIEWGLLTNGQYLQIVRVESHSNSQNDHILAEIPLSELNSNWEIMRILSKDALTSGESSQIADQFDTRKQGIRTLQNNRSKILRETTELLVDYAGEPLIREIETETAKFIDELINEIKLEPSDDSLPKTPVELLDTVGTILPGRTEEIRHERAETVLEIYKILQEKESFEKDDIEAHLTDLYPEKFANEDGQFERHWVNYIRDSLAELPRIEKPAGGTAQIWRYVPPELDQQIRVDNIDEWILNLREIPSGSRDAVDRQQCMIQQVYDYIKEHGEVTKDELEQALPPYTAHYQSFNGFWGYCLRKALSEAEDIGSPTAGRQNWYYIGDPSESFPPELDLSIDDWILEQDITGSDLILRERQLLVQFSYNHLKQIEEAQKGDFQELFRINIPSYTGHYNTFNSLWNYILKDTLKEAPNVLSHRNTGHSPTIYRYTGSENPETT